MVLLAVYTGVEVAEVFVGFVCGGVCKSLRLMEVGAWNSVRKC